ncbi:hypothetical protein QBC37DRAFT_391655 [Rhypophila decipiens]|uniref:Uncharacterized protein n=1 Tax=Rhypophila decipiens TaxID=261697 RepID=A0AAN7B3G2_9PEZI|nr:hypothetical protein QBC37DRAFT_391655 [Rhypophila decipiens]
MKLSLTLFALSLGSSLPLQQTVEPKIDPNYGQDFDIRTQVEGLTKREELKGLAQSVTQNAEKPRPNKEWYINVQNERIPRVICHPGKIPTDHLRKGIEHLRGLRDEKDGESRMGPGPGPSSDNCGRVSCSQGAAIYWCNDTEGSITVSWDKIADSVERILDSCPRAWGEGRKEDFSPNHAYPGEEKHDGGWRVVIKEDEC